jgi:hypothetical protein
MEAVTTSLTPKGQDSIAQGFSPGLFSVTRRGGLFDDEYENDKKLLQQ